MKKKQILILLAFGILVVVVLGVLFGTSLATGDAWNVIVGFFTRGDTSGSSWAIVFLHRLPRVLVSVLAGCALGLAGWLSQTLFRNDLADPYIAGIGSGAILGVNLTLLLGLSLGFLGMSAISVAAFAGSWLACVIIWFSSSRTGSTGTSLILSGVALSFVVSGINFLIVMVGKDVLSRSVFWSWSGLSSSSFEGFYLLLVVITIAAVVLPKLSGQMDAYLLGDEQATYLGVNPKSIRIKLFILVSLLTGVAVATAGLMGFVGLIIPHITRRLFGGSSKLMLPGSILLGGIVLGLADTLGRSIIPHQEIPAAVIMSIIGGIFFFWLVIRRPSW
ncbi:MAG TPA: iron ABC transporter permease [Caldisericia bacterium]|nr:iron ABC transporter permease [Caldisericia bacterium]HPF49068.1 iron ABC transporter permease [Caldisericia bacterium]HPI83068.1 iron ABC transporter permease [Caldisericia bacterium]HPQ92295.1 iron ABC transporter permease [Caldisericia bacterium]HRV74607.1 iron ABC transporter permease [Caldisericia bacterium]